MIESTGFSRQPATARTRLRPERGFLDSSHPEDCRRRGLTKRAEWDSIWEWKQVGLKRPAKFMLSSVRIGSISRMLRRQ